MATKSSESSGKKATRVFVFKIGLSVKALAFLAACACLCFIVFETVRLEGTPDFDEAAYGLQAILYPENYPEYAHLTGFALAVLRPFVIAAALALGCVILLTVSTGRRRGSGELHMSRLDSVFSDILVVLLLCFCAAFVGANMVILDNYYVSRSSTALPFFCALITAICAPCALAIWLSLVRKIKAGKLLKHTLVFWVLHGIFRAIRGLFRAVCRFFSELFVGRRFSGYPLGRALILRQTVFIFVSFACTAGFIMALLARSASLCLLWLSSEVFVIFFYISANNRTFEDFEKINVQICHIQEGNMTFDPEIRGDPHICEMSRRLLGIGNGMQVALESRLASERMKIALVTNVSHDLKTPLTSIIGYIDLLRRDESLSGEARDYVSILAQKSHRLKTIIDDLFDLAKTTSGDRGALDIEILDFRRLIEQTLADMDDKIESSSRILRTKLPPSAVFIQADGRKLYRVIQNIIDNALKYSMPGTRIYVGMTALDGQARVTFKNTASYEMDFTAQEILERFVRGDKSRSTEGSGLGLSIAAGFARAMQGDFHVEIDGDQFTVALTFPLAEPPREPELEPQEETAESYRAKALEVLRGKLYRPPAGVSPRPIAHVKSSSPLVASRSKKGGKTQGQWSIDISIDYPPDDFSAAAPQSGEQGEN